MGQARHLVGISGQTRGTNDEIPALKELFRGLGWFGVKPRAWQEAELRIAVIEVPVLRRLAEATVRRRLLALLERC